MAKLPVVLENEPLVEALFEVRFEKFEFSLAEVLAGFLLHKLGSNAKITRLPPADIPHPVRMNEQALLFAPLQRIELDRYFIMLGDRNIVLSCKLPYPKWNKFKLEIFRILNAVAELNFSTRVERYSMKYVNILSAESPKDQLSKINLDIRLAGDRLETEQIMLRVEAATKNAIHISTIASGAEVTLIDGRQLTGIVVDIDSIRNVPRLSYPDFLISLKSELEELRLANKEKFFSCLTPETLKSLRPIYG